MGEVEMFEKEILESFQRLNKSPRDKQVEYIDQVLRVYLEQGKSNCILNAPTGTGKSIIGAVVADVLHYIIDVPENRASFILMGNNMLTQQYAETFDGVRDVLLVKGANNYRCHALSTEMEPEFADSCCSYDLKKSSKPELNQLAEKYCGSCEFARLKKAKHVAQHVITNFSYFFIDRLFTKQHAHRTITVWDEAHTVNDAFAEHCAVYISEKRLKFFEDEVGQHLKLGDTSVFVTFKELKLAILNKQINSSNYFEYLEKLHKAYKDVQLGFEEAAQYVMQSELKQYSKLMKIGKKYADMACKIGDLIAYQYEHVFELNVDTNEVTVKPIFVNRMFDTLINSQFQLFMSATVSDVMLYQTLGLDPADTAYVKLEPSFPVENKRVVFLGVDKLNYTTMQLPETRKKLQTACYKLVDKHASDGESGIILTPSFDVTELVSEQLYKLDVKVFQHQRGTKLVEVIKAYKAHSGEKVLISPSMFEGLSLDDELSRYQIFVKCPFASLGEKRMKYIAEHHKDIYTLQTILKLVQGAGRSVRSKDDHAVTYMLDSMIDWTWKNRLNEWKNEFQVSFSSLV